jgi:uncharacterized protein (DUF2132 family)
MNKQILENRLIGSVALVINLSENYSGSQLVSQIVCFGTSPEIKSKSKSLTFTELLRTGNQKIPSNWT